MILKLIVKCSLLLMTQYFGTEKLVCEEKQKGRFLQLYKMNDVETMVRFIVPIYSDAKMIEYQS